MFNNEDIKAYREISAPEGLRERVMAAARTEKKKPIILSAPMRSIAAIAACLVFAVLVMIPMMTGGNEIYFGGESIGAEGIALASDNDGIMPFEARAMGLDVSLTLDAEGECYVTVSEGRVGDIRLSYMGPDANVSGDATLRWIIDLPDTEKTYFMTVETEDGSLTLSLEYGDSGWMIRRTNDSN